MLAQHLPQRRIMLGYAVLLVAGSVLTAAAQNAGMFIAGHVIQGLCTSLLLIAAVPPLAIGFPKDKLRNTAVIMNMCIFGAVALGPFIGGLQAEADAWRPLFWIVAAISAIALVLVVLTFEDAPPGNPDSPRDLPALGLAAVGCVAAFFGASELTSHAFLDAVVDRAAARRPGHDRRADRLPVPRSAPAADHPHDAQIHDPRGRRRGGAVRGRRLGVGDRADRRRAGRPLQPRCTSGLLYLPEVAGAIITAFALGFVITRKSMHYLPLIGMAFLAAGIVVFRIQVPSSQALTLIGAGLTGIGLGATVAPALFVAGFSLPSANLQRVFAIIELLRAVAAFMIAPIFVHVAATVGDDLVAGTGVALWIGLALAVAGAAIGVSLYALGGARAQAPDIDLFLMGEAPAWYSPPLLARLRGGRGPRRLATGSVD